MGRSIEGYLDIQSKIPLKRQLAHDLSFSAVPVGRGAALLMLMLQVRILCWEPSC